MFIPKGGIAQLGERGLCKPEARGSNPLTSTNNFESLATAGLFHAQGSTGSLVKVPHIAKPDLKGVGTRPVGIIPSVMMKPLST